MVCSVNNDECYPGRLKLGMCEKHYRRMRKTGSTEVAPLIDNLSQYVITESGCWQWTGALWGNGYGKPSKHIHGTRLAHRAFYIEHVGPIPDGYDVDHRCHNADPDCVRGIDCLHRRCVNPEHLEPATRQTNLLRATGSRTLCENGLHDLSLPGALRPGTVGGLHGVLARSLSSSWCQIPGEAQG